MARTKVNRLELLARVEAVVYEDALEYARQLERYDAALQVWYQKVQKALTEFASQYNTARIDDRYASGYQRDYYIKVSVPERPAEPREPKDESLLINTLRMSVDENISVDLKEFTRFLKG